jgi:hypothetical protein
MNVSPAPQTAPLQQAVLHLKEINQKVAQLPAYTPVRDSDRKKGRNLVRELKRQGFTVTGVSPRLLNS